MAALKLHLQIMQNKYVLFGISVAINFVVLALVSMVFEYFDSGDDPIYDGKEAIKNLIVALCLSGSFFGFYLRKRKET